MSFSWMRKAILTRQHSCTCKNAMATDKCFCWHRLCHLGRHWNYFGWRAPWNMRHPTSQSSRSIFLTRVQSFKGNWWWLWCCPPKPSSSSFPIVKVFLFHTFCSLQWIALFFGQLSAAAFPGCWHLNFPSHCTGSPLPSLQVSWITPQPLADLN